MATRLAVIGTGLLIGVIVAHALAPPIAGMLPNDLARNRTILRALKGHPQIVVFGDSRAEAAVDAVQLANELPRFPLAYNLATHSQTTAQSFLFQQQLPSSVRTVVQFVTAENLGSSIAFDSNVFNSMYLYGYRPSQDTRVTLARCFSDTLGNELDRSDFMERFQGRWIFRQAIDSLVRSRVRRDLLLSREENDIYFPTAYGRRLSDSAFAIELAAAERREMGRMTSSQRCVLLAMIDRSRIAGRRIVFVMTPVHPKMRRESLETAIVSSIRNSGGEVLDLSNALEDADFFDPLHANARGAEKITSRLAAALRTRG